MRKILVICICFWFLLCSSNLFAMTKSDLLGDYKLVGLRFYVDGDEMPTRNIKGKLSCTESGLVVEMEGDVNIGYWVPAWYWACGFYTFISSNRIRISVVGEPTNYADVYISNNILTSYWNEYEHPYYYEYVAIWEKTNKYYTQDQYDNKPVPEPEKETKVIVIPMM
jgi:hypothetical protein